MNVQHDRPDPDALLRRVQRDEARAARGRLRVFLGFAPGVGKTCRMLQVAAGLVAEQQLDVVIGIVETHGRRETAELARGLEVLPRRLVEYRGRSLSEFDLDAALARHPAVILVDELAHTNVPGSRHPKRWQDVEELLAAGIDVLTTMNIQHVESLNDVIEQITRVAVRETVPDAVLDGADAIEVVDLAPEELLQRLAEGKVYLPEQAQQAARHFFRRGNLLALRELALRRTAQHVDEEVREYRQEHGVTVTWPAGERILVCVGPAPSSGRLIRAAARMAAGLRCPWVAAYAESTVLGANDADQQRLEAHLRLAESLGATVTRLSSPRIADALLAYARQHNVTRIVIGKPTHSRLRDRLRGSLVSEVVRGSGDIDIHVISGDGDGDGAARTPRRMPEPPSWKHHAAAIGLVGATLLLAVALRTLLDVPDPEMLFLLTVMVTAVWFGRGPALLAAGLGVACYDFVFVPPFLTFTVADRRYFLTFAMMFGVGFAMSELAGRLKRQERAALAREQRTAALYMLTRELGRGATLPDIAAVAVRQAAEAFAAHASVMHAPGDTGRLVPLAASPGAASLDAGDLGVAQWSFDRGMLAGFGTDTLSGARCICAPLRVGEASLGVLLLRPEVPIALGNEQRAFLDVFCRQVAVALGRARFADEARAAALRARTEEMRSSLLSTVSHDLRTPLASITGAATALRDDAQLCAATRRELVDSICEEAERLERLVANLLDMTRLESGALALRRDWVPLEEIVGSALTRLEQRLGERDVRVELPADLPLLWVDPVLLGQLLVNVLENACKYTPADTPLEIRAWRAGDRVLVEVADHGPGLPPGALDRVFEKFYRGNPASGIAGAGLGLSICRAIAEAHGGGMQARNGDGGGAVFRVELPVGGAPPSLTPGAAT